MQFAVVHEIAGTPGRLRARAPQAMSRRQAGALAERLADVSGLTDVRVNARTGSVLFAYTDSTARRAACLLLCGADMPAPARCVRRCVSVASSSACSSSSLSFGGGTAPVPACADAADKPSLFPLVHYFLIRPLLPLVVRVVGTLWRALPYLIKGLSALGAGRCSVEVLDGAAILVSLLRRDFRTARTTMLLLGLGEMLESWTRQQSLASLKESLALNVSQVWTLRDGAEVQQPLDSVREGDVVIVRAGGAIPVDGVVSRGEALVNQASMTGEPLPVRRGEGASVFAGTVVEEGTLFVQASHVGAETRLQQVVAFINESESAKAGVQGRYERMADMAVPFTFLLSGLVWLLTRDPLRASSVLLVDYSCALKLTTPLTVLTAMREAALHGVLIKGGRYLEALRDADTVLFDKTGTLTQAQPQVVDVLPAAGWSRDEVLRLAACLEEHFPHPVARAVVRQAAAQGLLHEEEHTEVQYVVAHGVASLWRGKKVVIGSRHYVECDEHVDITPLAEAVREQAAAGRSLLYLAADGIIAGLIAIEDPVREESAAVVAALRARGISRIIMLTGDDARTAAAVADKLGITEFRAQILPTDKAAIVQELQGQGRKVIMIGDGINDSPALSAADVGVSLRDGADLAQEVANVVLLNSRLESLLLARDLAEAALTRIHSNFRVTMTLNTAFLAGGLAGVLTPANSALLHNATTVGMALRSMRPLLPAVSVA